MKISSQLKGGIYEVSFGYHSKLDGYATLMSDIPELCEIALCPIDKGLTARENIVRSKYSL